MLGISNELTTYVYCAVCCKRIDYDSKYRNFGVCTHCGNSKYFIEQNPDLRWKMLDYNAHIPSLGVYVSHQSFNELTEEHIRLNPHFDRSVAAQHYTEETPALDAIRYNNKKEQESKPKCPTCGSTNVSPISTTHRVVSGVTLGVFSGDIGKSYQCNSCKYKW